MASLGTRIGECRKSRKMTQEQLAEYMDVSSQAVSKWENEEYTFEEWLDLDHNEEIDLIDGVLYMRGEPSRRHQDIVRELTIELGVFLRGKDCRLYTHPFMVKLNKKTVVHPDISVICDKSKLNDRGCLGAPDFVIEILSPTNAGDDIFRKYHQYRQTGVKEYWIVDPDKNIITVYILEDGNYIVRLYTENETLPVSVLPGCEIDLKVIFSE